MARSRSSRRAPPPRSRAIRARFGFGERPVLLYTGNLDGYQNLELLLASIAQVRAHACRDALLVLATHATPRELPPALRRLADGVRLVTRARLRDRARPACRSPTSRSARASEWSGFPMKLLNYMAAAKPSWCRPARRKRCGTSVNGWIVRDRSATAYADAIVGLLAESRSCRSELGAAARRTVEDEYGWERVIDQVEATYRACHWLGASRPAVRPLGSARSLHRKEQAHA